MLAVPCPWADLAGVEGAACLVGDDRRQHQRVHAQPLGSLLDALAQRGHANLLGSSGGAPAPPTFWSVNSCASGDRSVAADGSCGIAEAKSIFGAAVSGPWVRLDLLRGAAVSVVAVCVSFATGSLTASVITSARLGWSDGGGAAATAVPSPIIWMCHGS